MKDVRSQLLRMVRRLGFFEYALILLGVLIIGALVYTRATPDPTISLTVRLADKDLEWVDNGMVLVQNVPPLTIGQKETDRLGRVTAEVTNLYAFRAPSEQNIYAAKHAVYVTFRLRGSFNAQANEYRYAGVPLVIGEWVRFTFRSQLVHGMVVHVGDGSPWKPPEESVIVKTQIKSEDPPWGGATITEVTGVDRFIADAIAIGDTVTDSTGTILAEVMEKTVLPAQGVAFDASGALRAATHPRKVDVFLTLKLRVRTTGQTQYYLETVPVLINSRIPLFLPNIHTEARVTQILTTSPTQ